MSAELTIGNVASLADVSVETVRFYERRGLIKQPPRPPTGGFRHYPEETVRRIRFIRSAQQIGFTLRECSELLALQEDPGADCGDVRERANIALDEVNRKLEQLTNIKAGLTALIAACPGQGSVDECSIIRSLEGASKAALSGGTTQTP